MIIVVVPYEIKELDLQVPSAVHQGDDAAFRVTVQPAKPAPPVPQIVRVQFFSPDGKEAKIYRRKIVVKGGGAMKLPLASNDAIGVWRVRVQDIISGKQAEASFEVEQSPVKVKKWHP